MTDKLQMLTAGKKLAREFCTTNGFVMPPIVRRDRATWPFGRTCAYWRNRDGVNIVPELCADRGFVGRAWSWPGYAVDKTPTGVVCHEIGHLVDWTKSPLKGNFYGDFGKRIRRETGEDPLTTYAAENDAEWFAEAFRLFLTNPDLLRELMPRTYRELRKASLEPVVSATWREVLADAPERTIKATENRLDKARRLI